MVKARRRRAAVELQAPASIAEDRQQNNAAGVLIDAMGKYLLTIGWQALVGGGISIEQGEREFVYYLRIKFTGGQKREAADGEP